MNENGEPAKDNPFSEYPFVYSYGHRNPQGLALSSTGIIYQHEHGPQGGDEVNVIQSGKNYGWPIITYGLDYNGAYVSPFTEMEGMTQPLHVWTPSIAPSGLAIYEGDLFPQWQGDLFVGDLNNQHVKRLRLETNSGVAITEEIIFTEVNERVRDVGYRLGAKSMSLRTEITEPFFAFLLNKTLQLASLCELLDSINMPFKGLARPMDFC